MQYMITAFTYEAEDPLTEHRAYPTMPTTENIERFFVDFTRQHYNGVVTQEDIDFVRYNLTKFGYAKFAEQYCFNLFEV